MQGRQLGDQCHPAVQCGLVESKRRCFSPLDLSARPPEINPSVMTTPPIVSSLPSTAIPAAWSAPPAPRTIVPLRLPTVPTQLLGWKSHLDCRAGGQGCRKMRHPTLIRRTANHTPNSSGRQILILIFRLIKPPSSPSILPSVPSERLRFSSEQTQTSCGEVWRKPPGPRPGGWLRGGR